MINSIYLDLDETLAATVDAVLAFHNKANPYLDKSNWGKYDLHETVNMEWKAMWKTLPVEFWANIPKFPWADALVYGAKDLVGDDNVYFLTAPVRSEGCYYGKQMWVEKNYPDMVRKTIMTSAKYACVQPDGLLVDDSEKNEKELKEAGKHNNFYLFPNHNNSKAGLVQSLHDNPDLVYSMLRTFIYGLH
jgi:5'(3')-deoxyribonucleotidase